MFRLSIVIHYYVQRLSENTPSEQTLPNILEILEILRILILLFETLETSMAADLSQFVLTWRNKSSQNEALWNTIVLDEFPKSIWKNLGSKPGYDAVYARIKEYAVEKDLPLVQFLETQSWAHLLTLIADGCGFHGLYDERCCLTRITQWSKGWGSPFEAIVWNLLDKFPELLRFEELWIVYWLIDKLVANKIAHWEKVRKLTGSLELVASSGMS